MVPAWYRTDCWRCRETRPAWARRAMNRSLIPVLLTAVLASSACATQAPDTLKKIKETGTLTIGFRESSLPFSFSDRDKQPTGYSIDLCKKIAESIQRELSMTNMQVKW